MTSKPGTPYRPLVTVDWSESMRHRSGFVEKLEDWMPNPPLPELPALYDDAIIAAAKVLSEGRAEPHQQQLMVEWWLNRACRLRDWPYVAGSVKDWPYLTDAGAARRASDILMGMQKPAHEFVKLVQLRSRNQSETEQG